jgi:hypothetical protein
MNDGLPGGVLQSLTAGPLASYGLILLCAVLIASTLVFSFMRRLVKGTLSIIAGVLLLIFSIWSLIFWLPTAFLFRRFIPTTPLAATFDGLLRLIGSLSGSALTRGDRLKAAQLLWPRAKFGFLYREIPPDIQRPLVEDGKLIGGVPATWLSDRYVTSSIPRSAVELAVLSFLEIFVPVFIYFVVSALWAFFSGLGNVFRVQRPILENWPGANPLALGTWGWYSALIKTAAKFTWYLITANVTTLEHWAFFALGIALILIPGIVYAWRATMGARYQMQTKDAEVRWPYRAETREILNTTYNRQVELASDYLKESPLFRIGEATGILRLRGDLTAPVAGQTIAIDQDALFQHILVLGGTGEGKTSGVLRPLMRQLMPMQGYGMYVCDAKGVLWRDAFHIATQAGREADVVVIGTGRDQFGVDPIAELSPTQVAATLRSVLRQIGGASSDSFWPDLASNILRNVLTIGHSYAQTPEGKSEATSGTNPYSLWWAYQAVLDDGMLTRAIASISKAETELRGVYKSATAPADRQQLKAQFQALLPADLTASVKYLEGAWATMAKDTKSGIIANVTQLLDGFSGAHQLRERFACGRKENTINLSEALRGKIVLNAISTMEDGLPARLVIMLLKTTLYREARVREADWKAMSPPRNPQDQPCIVIMDEVQEIATADPTSGLSDATFWNVARSAGLAGIFATQTIAALEQAMGLEAAANFLQQARSKIFFRSEDRATVEYACWCAGEFERDRVYEDGLYESVDFKELLTGQSYFEAVDETVRPRFSSTLFFQMAMNLIRRRQFSWDILPTKPFIGTEPGAPVTFSEVDDTLTRFALNRQAAWREEDREWRHRSTGNDIVPALTPADLIAMGRWHAYAHVQRAGAVRQDLMVVKHEHA